MGKTFIHTIIAKKVNGQALEPEGVALTVDEVTVLHVQSDLGFEEKFTDTPEVFVNRLISVQYECHTVERCVLFGRTCDLIYLPPGRYNVTVCPINSLYFDEVDDMERKVVIVGESVTPSYRDAVNLNAQRGC